MSDASTKSPAAPGRVARFFDILGVLGFLLAVPACLVVLGKTEEARALERALGPFASPGDYGEAQSRRNRYGFLVKCPGHSSGA